MQLHSRAMYIAEATDRSRTIDLSKGAGFVQKRQLVFLANDLRRGLADQTFERAGEMCLVEEPSLVDGIENRDALLQEIRRISSAFDLAKSTVGHARGPQKMPLH